MDGAAYLELVDLQVAPSQGDAQGAAEVADLPVDLLDGASPQLWGLVVPHDVCAVVVAVQTQGLPEPRIGRAVALPTDDRPTVGARAAEGSAGLGPAGTAVLLAAVGGVNLDDAVVDRAEAGCGGGDEQRDVFVQWWDAPPVALQPGPDQVVGVLAVRLGARRAGPGAAVAAGGVDGTVGHVLGGIGVDALPGGVVDVDVPVEPDRVLTAGRASDVAHPVVEVIGAGPVHDLPDHGV